MESSTPFVVQFLPQLLQEFVHVSASRSMGFTMDWFSWARNSVGLGLGLVVAAWSLGDHCQRLAAQQPAQAAGAGVALESTALGLAPADVAFFSTSLNLQKCWQEEIESGWVAEFRRVPYVQQLEQFLQEQWDNPQPQAEQIKTFLSSPIVRDIAKLLGDMASRECFIYGEDNWCDFLEEFVALQYEVARVTSDEDQLREFVLSLEKEDLDAIPIPTTIIGFQLSDQENARTQLDALEGIAQLALGNIEPLKPMAKRLRRKDLKNGQILSMTLAANDIPWGNLPAPDDDAAEVVKHLSEVLKDRQVVLSLAVIANRLFIAISDSAETLLNVEGAEERLLAADAIAPVLANRSADLRSINYTSGDWRNAAWQANFGNYFQRLAFQLSNALIVVDADDAEKLQAWHEELVADCEWLDEQIADLIPEFEDALVYSFRSAEGVETFAYDWTPSFLLENAQPLAVARHGGTGPLILAAARQQWLEGADEIAFAVLEAVPKHFAKLVEAGAIKDADAEKAQPVIDGVFPILEDILATFRDKIVPALDGNETLLAITAQATATHLGEDAPPPPQPLPLPEVGMVLKLRDRDQFLTGCSEILDAINSLIDFVREQEPESVPPNFRIPEPEEETLPGGARYWFPSTAPAPLAQFELQMAINQEVAVLGYSARQVKDLYQDRALAARPAWYSPEQPTAAVGFVDIAGIFRAIKPWVRYGLSMSGKDLEEPLGVGQGGAPVPTGADVLQIWDTFKKFGKSAGTTVIDDDDVTVSHWIWVGE